MLQFGNETLVCHNCQPKQLLAASKHTKNQLLAESLGLADVNLKCQDRLDIL